MDKKLESKFEIVNGKKVRYITKPAKPEDDPYPIDSRKYGMKKPKAKSPIYGVQLSE